jgi:DNA invertase Pin-like site-specific DNA recombinase
MAQFYVGTHPTPKGFRESYTEVLARARANGTKLGRRRVDPAVEARILELKASGDGILKIGRKLGVGTSVVQRVFKQEPRPS